MSISGLSRLEKSIENFKLSLNPEDHYALKNYSDPSAEDVANFIKDLDEKLRQKQKRRRTLQSSPFATFVQSMQQFSSIVDTCVQSNPEIAALVWGGMKFVLLAFSNYLKYLEEIVDMCDKMGRLCPQFERFSKLFPNHAELQSAIYDFYAIVVDFFREALSFLYGSVIKQFAIATFRPFEEKFSAILKSLDLARETIDKEIILSSEQELHIDRVNNAQLRTDVRDLCHFTRANHQYHQDNQIRLSDEARRSARERVLQNISRYPYHFDFTNNLHKRFENSGLWIYKTSEYDAWLNSPKSSGLWYYAIPGFGKSVLTAGVVDSLLELSRLSRSKRHYVAYFFCTYTTPSSLLAQTILSSLLHQMFYYSLDLPKNLAEEIESRFKDKNTSSRVLLMDIQRFLTQIIENNQAINYIVVDGLDECIDKERGIVLRTLKKILEDVPRGIRILISSRGSQDIVRSLDNFQQLDLGSSNQNDIEAFIAQALQNKELEGQLPELPADLLGKIKSFLAENAKGLFIWVDLQIEEICKESRPEDIEAILPTLPRDLDELYDRIINRIQRLRRFETAQQIFKWVAYAIRPLTLEELKEATCLKMRRITCWADLHKAAKVDEPTWLRNCENLVVVNRVNQTVQFAHSTIKEFLESGKASDTLFHLSMDCHRGLAEGCVWYFKLPEITNANPQHQWTAVSKKGLNSLAMAAGNTTQDNTSWTNWMTWKLYKFNSYLTSSPSPSPSTNSNALIRVGGPTIIASQRQTFKYMLKTFPLLEYATTSWVFHYARNIEERDKYSLDEAAKISSLLLQRFDSIRFPWQNYFTTESMDPRETLFELLDWASENRISLIFHFISDYFFNGIEFDSPYRMLGRQHHWFIKYWLPINPLPDGLYESENRFEELCFGAEFAGERIWSHIWQMVDIDTRSQFSPTFPGYPAGKLSKNPDFISSLLSRACKRADLLLFNELTKILKLLPGATNKRKTLVKGPTYILISKYIRLNDYENFIRASIASGSLDILKALQADEYLDLARELPIETQFDLLHSVTDIGKTEYFRALMLRHERGLSGKDPKRPSLMQKASEIGAADIVKMCLRREDDLRRRSQINPIYSIQLAAKHNHLAVIEAMMPFLDERNVDLVAPQDRESALTHAIKNNNAEMAGILLDKGAKLVSPDPIYNIPTGATGASYFSAESRVEIFNFPLLQFSLNPSVAIADVFLAKRKEEFIYHMELEGTVVFENFKGHLNNSDADSATKAAHQIMWRISMAKPMDEHTRRYGKLASFIAKKS